MEIVEIDFFCIETSFRSEATILPLPACLNGRWMPSLFPACSLVSIPELVGKRWMEEDGAGAPGRRSAMLRSE